MNVKKEVLRMQQICFSENAVELVREGNFHLFEGEIAGLVGRNYSGKSTLLGAVTGEYPCQSGMLWINEKKIKISSIEEARKSGVFLIKDENSLISEFTISDTMKLNFAFVKKRERYSRYIKKCQEILKLMEVTESRDTRIWELNFHKRILVEMAQALVCDVKILVFDNVISMLSPSARVQMERLFGILKERGISIVLIENRADVILQYTERLCVMRRGRVVAELLKKEQDKALIYSLMDGVSYSPEIKPRRVWEKVDTNRKVLSFFNVRTEDEVLQALSFHLYEGETLGIWNENRHSGKAMQDLLHGRTRLVSGRIVMDDKTYHRSVGNIMKQHRIFLIPENDQLCTNMNLEENIQLAALTHHTYGGVVKKEGELRYLSHDLTGDYLSWENYNLFPSQDIPDNILVRKKAVLCRTLAANPRAIIYNCPFLKMDYQDRMIFNRDIRRVQNEKIAQIVISPQLDDLFPVCSRILRMEKGRIVQEMKDNIWEECQK